jgi:iron complex outermembrane receptor protein
MMRLHALVHCIGVVGVATATAASALAQAAGDTTATKTRRDTLESVVVRATRAPAATAAARTTVSRAELQRTYTGQDAPLALRSTPSMTAYSESGSWSGYSYVRFRGVDQTRLNITVDGVPLSDPEDQVLYFSNVPDFLGSVGSVEVGRGVGASTFGTSAFAGSLNFQSLSLATTERGGQADLSLGSYNTWRASVQGATGVSARGFAAYGRFSRQGTDGYREHSGNDAWSGYASAGWFGERDALKVTAMAGLSGIRLSYYAASEADLKVNRRTNPLTEAEGDRFHQEMVSAQYSRAITDRLNGMLLVYRNSAAGAYDVNFGTSPDGGGTQYGNFGLAHVWHGITSAFTWTSREWSLVLGGSASDYHRDHYLAIRPALDERLYDNTGVKRDAAAFAKGTWTRGALRVGGDLHVRYAHFRYDPSSNSGIHPQPVTWSFINPKFGVTWDRSPRISYYATAGRSWREPTRSDMLAGGDDLNHENINDILPFSQVNAEKVDDYEAGIIVRGARASMTANLFAMEFHNEIAPIGKLSLTGSPLRRNVPESYRRGLELDGRLDTRRGGTLAGNIAFQRSRIAEYKDEGSGQTFLDVEPLLTPRTSGAIRWDAPARRRGALSLSLRHVGEMHLANDGNDALTVPASTLVDAAIRWERGAQMLRLEVNNVLDANAFASGYTDGSSRYFYPIASRNVMVSLRRSFGGWR